MILFNGSQRTNHNTGKAIKGAGEGAIEAGVEAEKHQEIMKSL